MPTSMTTAPGLIQSPRIISGRPTAATTMSARRVIAGRSRVRECAMVTVQCACSSSCAIGLPTMLERPTTTASRPARLPSVSRSSIRQPSGVQGTKPSVPIESLPTLAMWKPSTSLSGSIASMIAASTMPAGSGSCTRMPSTPASALSARTSLSTSSCRMSAGRRCSIESMPAARVALPLLRT